MTGSARSVSVWTIVVTIALVFAGGTLALCGWGRKWEVARPLAGACMGEGVAGTAEYRQDDGRIHPVVVLSTDGTFDSWTYLMPKAWWSPEDGIGDVELVASIRRRWVCLGTRAYTGPSVSRYREELVVRLREAATGKVVALTVLQGEEPRQFHQTEYRHVTRVEGPPVPRCALEEWLRSYVER